MHPYDLNIEVEADELTERQNKCSAILASLAAVWK